jgi:hypothetical protein
LSQVPSTSDAAKLADWAELILVGEGSRSLPLSSLDRLLKGDFLEIAEAEFDDEADEDGGLIEETDGDVDLGFIGVDGEMDRDVRLELLLEEIKFRVGLAPDVYPFRSDDDSVLRVDACGDYVYLLLLVLSSEDASYRGERRTHEVERTYDLIALEAVRAFLGRESQAIRFAKSENDPEDANTRPKKFRDAIAWLRAKLDVPAGVRAAPDDELEAHWEMPGGSDVGEGRVIPNSYSDGGVDVVAWWKFKDGRRGSPVLLAQCTVQLNWQDKLHDINLDLWPKWIDFSMVPPQRALVIPFAINRDSSTFEDRSTRAGVVIDRLRFLELLQSVPCEVLGDLVDSRDRSWVDAEVASIR